MALIAYSVVKKKKVHMLNAHIIKNDGRYMAMGKDKDGNTITMFMSEENALKAVKNKDAKKGMGFK